MRIYARVYDCQDSTGHTTSTPTEHTTTGKGRNTGNRHIYVFSHTLKKSIKKVKKKFGINKKGCNFAPAIKSNNVMKVLKSTSLQMKVKRSHDFANQWAKVIVTECKTIYLVTVIVIGYELPSVAEWRISKKDAKDAFEAANIVAYKAYLRGEL